MVEIELNAEGVDLGVGDCFHFGVYSGVGYAEYDFAYPLLFFKLPHAKTDKAIFEKADEGKRCYFKYTQRVTKSSNRESNTSQPKLRCARYRIG